MRKRALTPRRQAREIPYVLSEIRAGGPALRVLAHSGGLPCNDVLDTGLWCALGRGRSGFATPRRFVVEVSDGQADATRLPKRRDRRESSQAISGIKVGMPGPPQCGAVALSVGKTGRISEPPAIAARGGRRTPLVLLCHKLWTGPGNCGSLLPCPAISDPRRRGSRHTWTG